MNGVFFTKTRTEAPTFWQRKRDDLWIEGVVAAAVSLVLGGFMGYWINTIA